MKMDEKEIESKIIYILKDRMEREIADITEDMELVADLGLSSLDLMDAVVTFEEEFGMEIPDEVITEFRTVGDIFFYLFKKSV